MVRKTTLTVSIVALLVLGGAGVLIAQSANPNGGDSLPRSDYAAPEKPSPLTAGNVGQYATEHEEAYIYESLVDELEGTLVEFTHSCDPYVAEIQSDDGFLVMLECEYAYEQSLEEAPHRAGESRAYTVSYRVSSDETVRNEPSSGGDPSDAVGSSSGGDFETSFHYRALPDRPSNLTGETARSYAIVYETAIQHNIILTRIGEENLTGVELHVLNASTAESNGQYTVDLEVAYSYTTESDGQVAVADGVPYAVTYVIDASDTERRLAD